MSYDPLVTDNDFLDPRWTPKHILEEKERERRLSPATLLVSLDCGQANDFSAWSILSCKPHMLTVHRLERVRGVSYLDIVARTVEMMEDPRLAGATLLLDYTGVGRPVLDMFKQAKVNGQPIKLVGITIHGGNNVTAQANGYGVPKRDLVYCVVTYLQHGFLGLPEKSEYTPILTSELTSFQMKRNAQTGHEGFAAREGEHDDMVLSLAQACWFYRFTLQRQMRPQARLISGR